jgi:hypothetical protein
MNPMALLEAARAAVRAGADEAPQLVDALRKALKGVPQRETSGYKLFRIDEANPGEIYPLFASDAPVPVRDWTPAEMGQGVVFEGANGRMYVPGKVGSPQRIADLPPESQARLREAGYTGKWVKGLAARPGWHASDLPFSTHIGGATRPGRPDYRRPNEVWGEVSMPADLHEEWQALARARGTHAKDQHIQEQIPGLGYYRYKTNPNMTGDWMIGGDMRVNRILSDEEVMEINRQHGYQDLPRRGPTMTPRRLREMGFEGAYIPNSLGALMRIA